jgi:tRNA threonylcarbamoyladenosine biosynthesis protein TsaB
VVLILIDKLLREYGLRIKDITRIEVNLGPGSFTGVRVGASVANALGFSLKIPVNGKKVGDLAEPLYNK